MSQVVGLPSMQERSAKYFVQTESPLIREFELLATASGSVERLRGLVVSLALGGHLTLLRSSSSRLSVNTWPVVSLSDLGPDFQNGASSRGDVGGVATTVIRLADIIAGEISPANPRVLPIKAPDCAKYMLRQGDILIIRVNGSAELVGRFIVCRSDMEAIHCDHFIRMRFDTTVVYPEYLRLVGDSVSVRTKIASLFISTAGQKTVNQAHVGSIKIVLPPLTEQHRIVARVEELMKLCDALEQNGRLADEQHARLTSTLFDALAAVESTHELAKNWQRIAEHFDLLLDRPKAVEALEQNVLQLAVRGLLVPQDASDEPAVALLETLRVKRGQKSKNGRRSVAHSVSIVASDEQPYQLPVGWIWTRLGIIGVTSTGGTPPTGRDEYFGSYMPHVKPGSIGLNGITYTEDGLSQAGAELIGFVEPQAILMVCIGGSIGKVAVSVRTCAFNQQINAVSPLMPMGTPYLFIALSCPDFQLQVRSRAGISTLPIISKGKWEKLLVPLPPLAEQGRIVARVEELRALCARLRDHLTAAREVQSRLADALVADAA